jgi:predicted nucleic acid-binding protein
VGKKVKVVFDTNVWISIFLEKRLKDKYSSVNQDLIVYVSEDKFSLTFINLESQD